MPKAGARPTTLLITRNLPPLVGGMERLVWHIVDELRAGYDVHVIGPSGCSACLPPGGTATEVPLLPLWRFLLATLFASIRLAFRLRPQLVFAGSGLTAPQAWLVARLSGGRCIAYLHGLDIEARHPAYRLLWHPFLRRCDRILVNSRFTRDLAAGIGIQPQRMEILHPGVELPERENADELRAGFRKRHGLGDSPLMLYVGRITARKGLLPFVRDILPRMLEAVPRARLVVIGDEPVDALVRYEGLASQVDSTLREAGLDDRVIRLSQVTDEELDAAYFAADLLLFPVQELPNDHEGFGMVAIEAAAHGLPTVAFEAGGVGDAVADGRSGRLLPAGDDDGFARACITLLQASPDERATMAESARGFAEEFAWPDFGQGLGETLARDGT